MKLIEEALMGTAEEINQEIELRNELRNDIIGTRYSDIVLSEIFKLRIKYYELTKTFNYK